MSTTNNVNTNACDISKLSVLLHGDEQSEEFRNVSTHLESCQFCQQQLTVLAADDQTWNEVSSLLNVADQLELPSFDLGPDGTAIDPEASQPHLDLRFLEEPSHPEMLGRLGRYEIERVIGSGGMGIVLKGYDTELNRPVALKVLAPFLANNGAARQRFAREGRAAAAIVHEHVVAIHNVETDARTPFLVMQYVPGQSLQTRVDEQGPLAVKEILRIGMQTAAGLAAAHAQGVVHRDIKPSNILLENDLERVLLTDFGLARAADDATVTQTGIVAGTPHYMSPEQANGQPIDQRSDLFSLGALLYFMCTGHPPFRAERAMAVLNRICHDRQRPVWEINEEIPDQLADLIDRLLEKKPGKRIASAETVEGMLRKMLEKSQRPRKLKIRKTWQRQLRRYSRFVLAGCLLIGTSLGYVIWQFGIFSGKEIAVGPDRMMISKPIQPEEKTVVQPAAFDTEPQREEFPLEESPFIESLATSPEPDLQVAAIPQPVEATVPDLLAVGTAPQSQFDDEIKSLTAEINHVEAISQPEVSFFLPSSGDSTDTELEQLNQELNQLESGNTHQTFYRGE